MFIFWKATQNYFQGNNKNWNNLKKETRDSREEKILLFFTLR